MDPPVDRAGQQIEPEPSSLFPALPADPPPARPAEPIQLPEGQQAAAYTDHRIPPSAVPNVIDEAMPYRPFERQQAYATNDGFFDRLLYSLQSAWFNRQISLVGILALLTFAGVAGFAVFLIIKDFQPPEETPVTTQVATTIVDSPGTVAVLPTSVPPLLLEPASTHVTRESRGTALRVTTTAAVTLPPATSPPATTATSSGPAASNSTASSAPAPTTTTAVPTTTIAPATTARPTTTAPATTASSKPDDDNGANLAGPTNPLIKEASVSRVRATSARVSFRSSACVTAVFSYAAANGASTQVSGGARCSSDHTLLLGTVTPSLTPGTTYTVVITASDGDDAARETLSFTTLG